MGQVPFDLDQWMRQGHESDLPPLKDGETFYHFEVRTVDYLGTFFKLGVGQDGKPGLQVGGAPKSSYGADLDGWRAAIARINKAAPKSPLGPRVFIWLHGSTSGRAQVRDADTAYNCRLEQAMTNVRDQQGPFFGR